jgi:hypothetical protein
MTERDGPEALSPDEITSDSPFTLPGFFGALSEGQLLGGRCDECDERLLPPRPACYACGSRTVRIEEQPKTGEVFSYTEVRRPPPAFADAAPFTVAIVELDSGVRLTGRVTAPYEDVGIGMDVRLVVREPTEDEKRFALDYEREWPLHRFEPVRTSDPEHE